MYRNLKSGFTLLEIMIVVAMIGLLLAMALPLFDKVRQRTQNTRLANDFRVFSGLIETFMIEEGTFAPGADPGQLPDSLVSYFKPDQWSERPAIGGAWDIEQGTNSVQSAIGIDGFTAEEEQIQEFDNDYDDGNLTTGLFRKFGGNGYYFIIVE